MTIAASICALLLGHEQARSTCMFCSDSLPLCSRKRQQFGEQANCELLFQSGILLNRKIYLNEQKYLQWPRNFVETGLLLPWFGVRQCSFAIIVSGLEKDWKSQLADH